MQTNLRKIEMANIELVAISYDPVKVLKEFSSEKKITFALLSDQKSRVIRAYGILDERSKGKYAGIPYPTTFLIDDNGIVRSILNGTTKKRHSIDDLIDAAKKRK